MAITVASLTSGTDAQIPTSATAVTASITPTANRLVILAVSSINFFSFDTISASGNGLTWVQIANIDIDSASSHSQLTLFRAMGASPSSGAVTITSSVNKNAFSWSIFEVDGVKTTGSNGADAVVQTVTLTGNSSAPTVTLGSFSSANNATFAAFSARHNAGVTITPETFFSEIHDVVDTTNEYSHIETEWASFNDTTPSATLSSSGLWGAVGLEIAAADVITATTLTSGFDETLNPTAVTASISPSANKLILLAVISTNFFQVDGAVASGNGLTWIQLANFDFDSTNSHTQLTLFRAMGASPSSGSVTITFDANKDAVAWSIVEFGGVNTSGTNGSGAIVQLVSHLGNDTAPNQTLSAFGSVNNATYAAIGTRHSTSTIAPDSGFTELHDVTDTNGHVHAESQWKNANDTTVGGTLSAASPWGIVGVEIKASTSGSNLTLNPTGVSTTPAVGTIIYAGDKTAALTGISSTPAVGSITREDHGVQANGSVGTLVVNVANNIISVISDQITGSVGSVSFTDSETLALTGISTTPQVGITGLTHSVAETGVESVGAIGTVGFVTSLSVVLSGVSSTPATGTIIAGQTLLNSFGVESVGAVGTVGFVPDLNIILSSVTSTPAVGILATAFAKTLIGREAFVLDGQLISSSVVNVALTGVSSTPAVGTLVATADQSVTLALNGVQINTIVANLVDSGGIYVTTPTGVTQGQATDKFKKRPQVVDHTLEWTLLVIGSEERYYVPKIREHYPSIREDELSHTINNIVTSMHTFFNANSRLPSLEIILKREKEVVKYWALLALQTYNASVKLPTPPLHMSGLLDR
jgi:hypothetical protein